MLAGQTVLIVETEFLIALDIQRCLETFGAAQTIFARDTAEALNTASLWPSFGLALVEFRHGQDDDLALLQGLRQADVKLVLLTADTVSRGGDASLPSLPVVTKPFLEEDLASAIRQALAS
ncbi:MAG TPA: hypothetical protein VL147_15375 [Devosia sp.]|nr:hypothetical protein [Devosia sp.]